MIFDEVQEVPKALAALKYFYEEAPEYAIVAAGSLLGVAMHQGTSFSVGKVDFLNLYPLNYKEFEMAIQWLLDCGLIHKSRRIEKPGIPLISYMDMSAFKIYMPDVGLLAAKGNIAAVTLLEKNKIFSEFKGALTEQFVAKYDLKDAVRTSMSNYREQDWMVNVPLFGVSGYLSAQNHKSEK